MTATGKPQAASTEVVHVRYQHFGQARLKGRPRVTVWLSETAPLSFSVVDPSDAPVAARVERRSRCDLRFGDGGWILQEDGQLQVFEFRSVDGALMRTMLAADGATPLTFDHLSEISRDSDLSLDCWRDHPSPVRNGAVSAPFVDAQCYRDFEELGDSGRGEMLAGLVANAAAVRVIDGVMYRPSLPPAWAVTTVPVGCGCVGVTACVPDYDSPILRSVRSAFGGGLWNPAVADSTAVADPRLSRDDLRDAIARQCGQGLPVMAAESARIDVFDEGILSGDSLESLALQAAATDLTAKLGAMKWRDVDPRLLALAARVREVAYEADAGERSPRDAVAEVHRLFAGAPAVLGSPPDVRFGNAARNVIHAIAAAWRGVDEAEAKLRADFDAVASMAP